jgi:type IV pilus assembly protein PilB
MAVSATNAPLSGLSRRLVQDGLIAEDAVIHAIKGAEAQHIGLVAYLVDRQLVSAAKIAVAASSEFGVPLLDLDALDLDMEAVKSVDQRLLAKHRVLPLLLRGKRLFLGVSDPTAHAAIDEIKFQSGVRVDPIIVEQDKLDALVGFVNKVMLDAIKRGASDIHFEPYEKNYRVRYPPRRRAEAGGRTAAGTGIEGHRAPQGHVAAGHRRAPRAAGRPHQDAAVEEPRHRLSRQHLPDAVRREGGAAYPRPDQPPSSASRRSVTRSSSAELYLDALAKPYGMILVTGPTGSGKTVSLYTGLNILNTEDTQHLHREDPVEINMTGINQVNVNPKVGLTFAAALRAFLRQDPDVIMVGEIRDLETAEIAIKAAQTGHLVLSTLHTNDAPQTLTRWSTWASSPMPSPPRCT